MIHAQRSGERESERKGGRVTSRQCGRWNEWRRACAGLSASAESQREEESRSSCHYSGYPETKTKGQGRCHLHLCHPFGTLQNSPPVAIVQHLSHGLVFAKCGKRLHSNSTIGSCGSLASSSSSSGSSPQPKVYINLIINLVNLRFICSFSGFRCLSPLWTRLPWR